jgi:hypothetical protein
MPITAVSSCDFLSTSSSSHPDSTVLLLLLLAFPLEFSCRSYCFFPFLFATFQHSRIPLAGTEQASHHTIIPWTTINCVLLYRHKKRVLTILHRIASFTNNPRAIGSSPPGAGRPPTTKKRATSPFNTLWRSKTLSLCIQS